VCTVKVLTSCFAVTQESAWLPLQTPEAQVHKSHNITDNVAKAGRCIHRIERVSLIGIVPSTIYQAPSTCDRQAKPNQPRSKQPSGACSVILGADAHNSSSPKVPSQSAEARTLYTSHSKSPSHISSHSDASTSLSLSTAAEEAMISFRTQIGQVSRSTGSHARWWCFATSGSVLW